MIFLGTATECADTIASVNASLGYPRQATQADLDSGMLVRVGGGVHVPLSEITLRAADAGYVDVDADGLPTSPLRRVAFANRGFGSGQRPLVARARVLRMLNRAPRSRLVEIPGIGPARADQIIAARAGGRMTDIEDVRDAGLPPAAVQAIRDYVQTQMGDEDEDDIALASVVDRGRIR